MNQIRTLLARLPRRLRALLFCWAPLILWMLWIYWLSARPSLPHPNRGTGISDDWFDYTAHAFTFGVLTWLAWRTADSVLGRTEGMVRWLPHCAGLFAALYALVDEIHQSLVPGRVGSWRDWLADLVGVLLLVALLSLRPRFRPLQKLLFSDPFLAD